MAYQVMQDPDGDYYIVSSKYSDVFMVAMWVEGMFQCMECQPDDILMLHAQPELSASKLAFEWVRKPSTWEAMAIFQEAIKAKLPGELPPEKEFIKKEFKLSKMKSSIAFDTTPLADICKEHKWEPSVCRRILRKAGLQPAGRWEWDKQKVPGIIQLISQSYK